MKVALIVGASGGIGAATARALAHPDRCLVLTGRNEQALAQLAAEIQARGAPAILAPGDITREEEVARIVATAAAIGGQIDALINTAGSAFVRPFAEITLADWNAQLAGVLTGVFLTCRHALPWLPAGGIIVNVVSVAARQAFPGWAAYSAAKAGVLQLTNVLREELRPRGVRVTAVLPAAIDTPLWEGVPGRWNRQRMLAPEVVGATIATLVAGPAEAVVEEIQLGHIAGRL